MRKLTVILAGIILFAACKKEECPEAPKPDPITYNIKYIVSGEKYWHNYYDPENTTQFKSDTLIGYHEYEYELSEWDHLDITAFPDSNTSVTVIIMVDGDICDQMYTERQDLIKTAKANCDN